MRVAMAALSVFAMVVGGCTDIPDSAASDEVMPTSGTRSSGPPSGNPPPVDFLPKVPDFGNFTISWEQCSGAFGWGDLPRQSVAGVLPEELAPAGVVPQTVDTRYLALECLRVVVGGRVYDTSAMLLTAVKVEPVNETWRSTAQDWFVLELIVENLDLPVITTSPGEFSSSVEPGAFSWTVRNGSTEFSSKAIMAGQPDQSGTSIHRYWFAEEDGLAMASATSSYTYDLVNLGPGVFVTQGEGLTYEVYGPLAPFKFQGYYVISQNWVLELSRFGNPED